MVVDFRNLYIYIYNKLNSLTMVATFHMQMMMSLELLNQVMSASWMTLSRLRTMVNLMKPRMTLMLFSTILECFWIVQLVLPFLTSSLYVSSPMALEDSLLEGETPG